MLLIDLGLESEVAETDDADHRLLVVYARVRRVRFVITGSTRSRENLRHGSCCGSLRAKLEHSLKEAIYNLLSWVRDNDDRDVDHLRNEIDHLFADANVQS